MKTQLEFYIEETARRLKRLHEIVSLAFTESIRAFSGLDTDLAHQVKDMSDDIEELSVRIEDNVLETIARRQPVARDLRALATYLYVSHHLYRVGRYAYKIAHITILCKDLEHYKELESIPHLEELAMITLKIAMDGILKGDLSRIDELEKMESESDHETSGMFEEIVEYLRKRQDITTMSMFYIIIGRYCERAADYAFAIAERAVYMHTGERKKLGLAYKGSASDAPH
ncbi:MAG: phosphate signaling complex protein PhoU [Candidatus Lokiarchaeota archaeon]|nr:phosphate signaling complex protein PhoU [Candidatus Lokiarchaeota archaeon]